MGGQNNHDWKKSTPFMKTVLDKSGHFATVVNNAPERDAPASDWDAWQPNSRNSIASYSTTTVRCGRTRSSKTSSNTLPTGEERL